jgi:CRISPR-associated protein Cas1
MKKSYYLFNPGRMSRKDSTLKFTAMDEDGNEKESKYIPVEGTEELFVFGSLDANSALYNFLGKNKIQVHFFDFYEHYTGSFQPKEYLLAGRVLIAQTQVYIDKDRRLATAKKFIQGASGNILKNLKYYNSESRGKDLQTEIDTIESLALGISSVNDVSELMGIEGNIRQVYYKGFNTIINDFMMENRSKRPPENEINAMISFGNSLCYATVLSCIYHTQLNPTISFLHEPGERRFSLALDIAEIFKPIITDRIIFKLLNKKEIQGSDFVNELNGCYLKDSGRKTFAKAFEDRLHETIEHRELKRKVSYKHLIKLECYKLVKHVMDIREYKPFKIWW